jgi:hypothetical protein
VNARTAPFIAALITASILLVACGAQTAAATATPAASATPEPTRTSIPTENPGAGIPLAATLFAGATATQPPGGEGDLLIWNPYESNTVLQFDADEWVLALGGDPQPNVFEGFQGLFHRTIEGCILSLSAGRGAPFTWTVLQEDVEFGGYAVRRETWRDETVIRVMVTYSFEDAVDWDFLLGTTGLTVSMPCIQAAERVLETLTLVEP